jgi:hypothetical protein
VNSPTGGPELAQIVTVRDIGEEAQIAHLELTDQARAIVGHELVFTAIHKAARHGIHRRHSPRTVAHVEPFGFTASTDQPGMGRLQHHIPRHELARGTLAHVAT